MPKTRAEIVKQTLAAIDRGRGETSGNRRRRSSQSYDRVVIDELNKRLPDGEIKTCEDFVHLAVSCCETCHEFYPHYDMYVETLPDDSHAWICHSVRSALLGIAVDPDDLKDLAEALGGIIGGGGDQESG